MKKINQLTDSHLKNLFREQFKEHTQLFTKLIEEYNQQADEDKKITLTNSINWHEDLNPKFGESRIS